MAENNYFAGGGAALEMVNCAVTSMVGNTLVGNVSGFSPSAYPNNTYASTGSGTYVVVRPNQYECRRAHVAVFNWGHLANVQLDVSQVLQPGDSYELRHVLNYDGAPVLSGTYDGAPLIVPMHLSQVAAPHGWTAPPHTAPEFGAIVLKSP